MLKKFIIFKSNRKTSLVVSDKYNFNCIELLFVNEELLYVTTTYLNFCIAFSKWI